MADRGYIEIHIEGTVDNQPIRRDNVDIAETKEILSDIDKLLGTARPELVSYMPEDGSIRHKFFVPIITVLFFTTITEKIFVDKSLAFLEPEQAKIVAKWQETARAKHWKITLDNSEKKPPLIIDETTAYLMPQAEWINTEVYLYGKVDLAGGVQKSMLEIDTGNGNRVKVQIDQKLLADDTTNRLYKITGIHATGKQNLIDKSLKDLRFVDYIQYDPTYRKEELDLLIEQGTKVWADVKDVDAWMSDLRGAYVAG
jgi:hypothetical protein